MEIQKSSPDYFKPKITDFDFVLFSLTNGDITKAEHINSLDYEFVYKWFYVLKVKELNELQQIISIRKD